MNETETSKEAPAASNTEAQAAELSGVLDLLAQGIATLLTSAEAANPKAPSLEWLGEFKSAIERLNSLVEKIPYDKARESILSTIKNLDKKIQDNRQTKDPIPDICNLAEDEAPAFIIDAAIKIGPQISYGAKFMVASVWVPRSLKRFFNADILRECLQQKGILFGVDEGRVDALFKKNWLNREVRIALGTQPARGEDAVIEECLNQLRVSGYRFRQVGTRVDYKDVISFEPVESGQLILKKIPCTDGTPGRNVKGEEIPSDPGVDLELPKIENTRMDGAGLEVYSDVDGCAFVENGQIKIVPTFTVKGNVDFESGNINSPVAVEINGDVLSDFKVESKMEIVVKGIVEGAMLKADGNIICKGSIKGKQKATLQSRKNIEVAELSQATAIAGKNVIAQESIIQSHVSAKRIECVEKRGEILGGKLAAWIDVCAKRIGSERGTKTEIVLGAEKSILEEKIEKYEKALEEKEPYLQKYNGMKNKLEKLLQSDEPPPGVGEKLDKINQTLESLIEFMGSMEEKRLKAQEELEFSQNCVRTVRAKEEMYPGVVVKIDDQVYVVREPLGPCCVTVMGDEIITTPYEDREFDDIDQDE